MPDPSDPPAKADATTVESCRFCGGGLSLELADLGEHPLSNGFLTEAQLARPEPRYPLRVVVCGDCRLAQLDRTVPPAAIFDAEYAYFSSVSSTWVEHARRFAMDAMDRFGLGGDSLVVEVASNDGYLLRHFHERGIPVLGIEPSANVAAVAQALGIETEVRFFGRETAEDLVSRGRRADLLVGNNVLAHVPDINGFVGGLAALLAPDGVLSLEFPHLLRLLEQRQFDTIYHEHYFYLSLLAVERVLAHHGLAVFDLEELPTHGGSLRLFARRAGNAAVDAGPRVQSLRDEEMAAGLESDAPYRAFAQAVPGVIEAILLPLREARAAGARIAGLGAAAKGNTLLNACGIGSDLIDFLVDASPHKQGLTAPGSRLPIRAPSALAELRPELVLILPWNLETELIGHNAAVFDWGGRFLIPIPESRIVTHADWLKRQNGTSLQESPRR